MENLSTCPSEPGQILADLPGSDLLVVTEPLVALHASEVVDVVLVAATAERSPEDVVRLELPDGLEKIRRKRLETEVT